jgi:hypothetical protein
MSGVLMGGGRSCVTAPFDLERQGRFEITHPKMMLIIAKRLYHGDTLGSSVNDRATEQGLSGRRSHRNHRRAGQGCNLNRQD